MLKVLPRSLPDLREQLHQAIAKLPRPLMVSQESEEAQGGEFARRQPYRHLIEHGANLTMVIVADDPNGGLWRDPVGDLAELTFPDRRSAAEAAAGYVLFFDRRKPEYLKRDLWDRDADTTELINRFDLKIPPPPKKNQPIKQKKPWERERPRPPVAEVEADVPPPPPGKASFRPGPSRPEPAPIRKAPPTPGSRRPGHRAPPVSDEVAPPLFGDREAEDAPDTTPEFEIPVVPEPDPFATLGLQPSATEEEVRKAFRRLMAQYHPDKVAHLAPEFRILAEVRAREFTEAYEQAQRLMSVGRGHHER